MKPIWQFEHKLCFFIFIIIFTSISDCFSLFLSFLPGTGNIKQYLVIVIFFVLYVMMIMIVEKNMAGPIFVSQTVSFHMQACILILISNEVSKVYFCYSLFFFSSNVFKIVYEPGYDFLASGQLLNFYFALQVISWFCDARIVQCQSLLFVRATSLLDSYLILMLYLKIKNAI